MQPKQTVFPGMDVNPYQDMGYKERVAMILENHEDARDNDNVMILRCLWEFHELHKIMDDATYQRLLAWAAEVPVFETYRRRRQEIQQNRSDQLGNLRPSRQVEQYRRRRDGAGPPRRRG